jgi:hypothetical protein
MNLKSLAGCGTGVHIAEEGVPTFVHGMVVVQPTLVHLLDVHAGRAIHERLSREP